MHHIPEDSGNQYTYGVEVENDGKQEPWNEELLKVCELVFATLFSTCAARPAG